MKKSIYTVVLLSVFFLPGALKAAPAMTQYAINDSTKECSEWFPGDEFSVCELPPGWQITDYDICPPGYGELVNRIQGTCTETEWSKKLHNTQKRETPPSLPREPLPRESQDGFENFENVTQISVTPYIIPKIAEFVIDELHIDAPYVLTNGEGVIQYMDIRALSTHRYQNQGRIQNYDTAKISNPEHMLDDDIATHTSFHFGDYLRKENQSESVTFDIIFEKPIHTDTLKIDLRSHVTPLFNIAIASVGDHNALTPLLSRQLHSANPIVFPETTSDHFRITIDYFDVFQANAIQFLDKNNKATHQRTVRFLAKPGDSYQLYSNAERFLGQSLEGESLYVWEEDHPLTANLETPQKNPFFQQGDTDGDSILDKEDNCILIKNQTQEDLDLNGIGDACEDFDYDGVLNANDNCSDEPNKNQKDTDGDGAGDVCDTEENRLLAKHIWLPQATLVLVSIVVLILIARVLRLGMRG